MAAKLLARGLAICELGKILMAGRVPRQLQQFDEDRSVDDTNRHLPAWRNRSSAAWLASRALQDD